MRMVATWILGAVLVLQGMPALSEDWSTYRNDRFGTTLDVPGALAPLPPPASRDGLSWSDQDGQTQLVVYASVWTGRAATWDGYRTWFGTMIDDRGGTVSVRTGDDAGFRYSGTFRGQAFDVRGLRSARCPDIVHVIEITYPDHLAATRAAWSQRIRGSLGEAASSQACP